MSFANRPAIEIVEGEPYEHTFTFQNPDGSAKDVSTYTFASQLRDAPDGNLLGTFAFDVSNAANGIVLATLPAAETSGWDDAYWSAKWTVNAVPFTFLRARAKRVGKVTS